MMLLLELPSVAEASRELPGSGGWIVEDGTGEPLAVVNTREEADRFIELAKGYYDEARMCGHPAAVGWVRSKLPIVARALKCAERDEIDARGETPLLQQEP